MPRTCTVCAHPEAGEIDAALIRGTSYRAIAGQYGGLSKSALERHRAHLSVTLTRAAEAEAVADANGLLAELQSLRMRTMRHLDNAEQANDRPGALQAIAEARRSLELLAKLWSALQATASVSLEQAEERRIILEALQPYPSARLAVAAALDARNNA